MIAKRVNCLVRADWGGLLKLLEADCKQAKIESKKMKGKAREDVRDGGGRASHVDYS